MLRSYYATKRKKI